MILLPIDVDESENLIYRENPECIPILEVYPDYYKKIGYHKPWIGYFATKNSKDIIGAGGYKGKPNNGKIEIAYATFKSHEGRGIGTEICRQLVLISLQTDPAIRITARTLQDGHASIRILQKNGFVCLGIVFDEDDGNVLEWEFKQQNT